MSGEDIVLFEIKNGAAWIKLNRLDKHNAINYEMVEKISQYLDKAENTEGVVAVVLTSNGKTFCAGLDLDILGNIERVEDSEKFFYKALYVLIKRMINLKKPVIIAVNGYAIGGAFELMYGGDIIVATENAKFSIAEARWGFVPPLSAAIGALMLGLQNATRLTLTTETIDAQTAKELGFVSYVVPQGKLEEKVMEIVNQLKRSSPASVREIKKIFSMVKINPLVEWAFQILVKTGARAENVENVKAFLKEKKFPKWKW